MTILRFHSLKKRVTDMYYALSRTAFLDVKWANLYRITGSFRHFEHYNPHYELIAVAEGPVHLQTSSGQMMLRTGDTLLLSPWELHKGSRQNSSEGSFFWVQFTAAPALQLLDHAQEPPAGSSRAKPESFIDLRTYQGPHDEILIIPRHLASANRYKILGMFEELMKEMDRAKGHYRYRASLLLGSMLELLADDLLNRTEQEASLPASYGTYRSLVSFLDNNYLKELSPAAFEKALDRRYEHLCHVFKRYAGITITLYIQQLRMQRAKYLLLSTDSAIQSIAREVGLEDPFHFSKLFKRLEGESPSEYRRRLRERVETGERE